MRRASALVVGCLVTALVGAVVPASAAEGDGFDESAYRIAALADVAATLDEAAVDMPDGRPADWLIDASGGKSRTVVRATGAERPLDARVKGLIGHYVTATRQDPGLAEIYRTEVEIEQDGRRFWMPIQDELVGYWREEMQRDDRAIVLVVHLGRADDVPVFVITGFRELLAEEDARKALREYGT